MHEDAMRSRRRRGVAADAVVAAGATLILLRAATEAITPRATVIGIALVLVGALLLWGVPQPGFRLRMVSGVAGLFFGYALATALEPGFALSLQAALRPDECVMPAAPPGGAVAQVCASADDAVRAALGALAGSIVLGLAWRTAGRDARA